jgi:hypothetical protein
MQEEIFKIIKMNDLTEKELSKISLGFNWTPNMSYEEFVEKNFRVNFTTEFEMYEKINERYIQYVYENRDERN